MSKRNDIVETLELQDESLVGNEEGESCFSDIHSC